MTRPCGSGFGGGCGGVSTAGINFPSGGCCPPCSPTGGILGLFGELQFATIPDFTNPPCFGGIPFTFVTTLGGSPTPLAGAQFARVTLNPVSSPQFVESSPGVLQYNGPTGKFFVSFGVTISQQIPLPLDTRLLAALICINGNPVQSSTGTEVFVVGTTDVVETLNGQALVQLKAGDMLTICVADLAVGIIPSPAVDNICINQFSLIAQSAG